MRFTLYVCLWSLVVGTVSCVPPSDNALADIKIDLTSPAHQKVYELIDRRNVDSVLTLLQSEDVTMRYLGALGAASMKDAKLSAPLAHLVSTDPSTEVREMAAYAAGQQMDQSILPQLISAFGEQDTTQYNTSLRGKILEAIGKSGDAPTLKHIATVSTYTNADDQLLLGQARAIYRYARRNIYELEGTNTMIGFLADQNSPAPTKMMAAQYLARYSGLTLDSLQLTQVHDAFRASQDPNVRMALGGALTKLGNPSLLPMLLTSLTSTTEDNRVKINILRALGSYPYASYQDAVKGILDSDHRDLFALAAQLLKNNAPRQEAVYFMTKAQEETDPLRVPQLYGIALNSLSVNYLNTRNNISQALNNGISQATQPTVKAEYIKALALDPLNLTLIDTYGLQSSDNFVRTAAIQATATLMTNPRSEAVYRTPRSKAAFRAQIAAALTQVLRTGDSGSIAAIASLAKQERLGYKEEKEFNLALRSAMRELSMPQDLEAIQEAASALSYLEDTTYVVEPQTTYHGIDWTVLDRMSDTARAYIITPKGQIEMQLYPKMAPGSVANFITLANDDYYDGKTIHRVVPNFVVQGGCPRGDGYGSLDYTIRTEVGPLYYDGAGYVGMASAGRDTEGTQWFITHSPTPHLDGNYSIFGKVTKGMEVVDDLAVGDRIQDVRILRY